jgi:hypothetical protein
VQLEEVAHVGERRERHHFRNDDRPGSGLDQSARAIQCRGPFLSYVTRAIGESFGGLKRKRMAI